LPRKWQWSRTSHQSLPLVSLDCWHWSFSQPLYFELIDLSLTGSSPITASTCSAWQLFLNLWICCRYLSKIAQICVVSYQKQTCWSRQLVLDRFVERCQEVLSVCGITFHDMERLLGVANSWYQAYSKVALEEELCKLKFRNPQNNQLCVRTVNILHLSSNQWVEISLLFVHRLPYKSLAAVTLCASYHMNSAALKLSLRLQFCPSVAIKIWDEKFVTWQMQQGAGGGVRKSHRIQVWFSVTGDHLVPQLDVTTHITFFYIKKQMIILQRCRVNVEFQFQ
jgi:hypothetical protein